MADDTISGEVVRTRIRDLEANIEREGIELDVLRGLLNDRRKTREIKPKTVPTKVGATEAVLSLVRTRPGISREDTIAELVDKIETKSPNPRRLLYMTIANLLGRDKLKADSKGLHVSGGKE